MQVQKKSRNRELVYGINAVEQAIETSPDKILSAWVVKGRDDDKRITKLVAQLERYGISAMALWRKRRCVTLSMRSATAVCTRALSSR